MNLSATHKLAALIVIAILLGASLSRGSETFTSEHCIIGLFSPDRVDDLRTVLADIPAVQLVNVDYDNARVTFRYEAGALFPDEQLKLTPTREKIDERLNKLLSEASDGTFTLRPATSVSAEKLSKFQRTIGLCDCKGCRYGLYRIVTKVDGVERATVEKGAVVTVWFDPAKTDQATVEKAVEKAIAKIERK